jgi:hypothetical protein
MTPLSKHRYAPFKWMHKIFSYTDDEMYEHCGMAAIVYLRLLRLGFKLCCVGIFNSFFLIPSNLHGCDVDLDLAADEGSYSECVNLTDQVEQLSFGNLSNGSNNVWATTVAAYIIFGSAIYFIYREFEWYTEYRHKFLTRPRPENYTVYIAHIPKEYRSDAKLLEYFRSIFSEEDVLDAKICLDLHHLEGKIAARKKVIEDLEHAVDWQKKFKKEPTHPNPILLVPSIPTYASQLNFLNREISKDIEKVKRINNDDDSAQALRCDYTPSFSSLENDSDHPTSTFLENAEDYFSLLAPVVNDDDVELVLEPKGYKDIEVPPEKRKVPFIGTKTLRNRPSPNNVSSGVDSAPKSPKDKVPSDKNVLTQIGTKTFGKVKTTVGVVGKTVEGTVKKTVGVVGKTVGDTVNYSVTFAKFLINGPQDGRRRDAGFVTFSTLLAKNQCQQIIHHSTPFTFYAMAAPRPEDIVWDSVGLPHKNQQISHLLAQAATAATCLFWTIPVSFLSSLSEVESLQELIPGLEKTLEKNEWLARFLANLSPLMLVLLTSLLPGILTTFCKKEGHIGTAELHSSLLTKLSGFMIIQIFFVQAISGSLTAALYNIIDDWTSIVDLLATTIPVQVKSFIQYVQVKNFLGCSFELLRVTRVVMAMLRHRFGPDLTEKERNKPWMGILPMLEPEEMEYPMLFANMILYFMINLVYSCIAPIMSYILLLCFGIHGLVFRHQLIYTYSKKNDDGGLLWTSAIMLLLLCMILSEITLIGIIFLKQAFIAGISLFPLIGCTVLFTSYIRKQHFRVTEYVPSTLCSRIDKNNKETLDMSFLKDSYLQNALKEKLEFPYNMQRDDVEKNVASDSHKKPFFSPSGKKKLKAVKEEKTGVNETATNRATQ